MLKAPKANIVRRPRELDALLRGLVKQVSALEGGVVIVGEKGDDLEVTETNIEQRLTDLEEKVELINPTLTASKDEQPADPPEAPAEVAEAPAETPEQGPVQEPETK